MSYLIKTQIEVDAPVDVIWDILVDCDSYHLWNPFIIEAKGQIAPNAQLTLSPRVTETRQTTFQSLVTSYTQHVEFTWTGAILHRWFAMGDHSFRLHKSAQGKVVLDHDELFYGIGGLLVGLLGGKLTTRGFVAMNEALKARAEKAAKSPSQASTPVNP